MNFFERLEDFDPEVAAACGRELERQRHNIELIASENIVSDAVLLAAGTPLTNKYAEGYPGRRYYGGCEFVDQVETIAIERAKKLFGAEHANVQPHCGAAANLAVFYAFLKPGDTVMGMNLAHGGHLSHGSPVNISGNYFRVVPYSLNDDTQMLDYEEIRRIALAEKPKLLIAGASAYSRTIDFEKIGKICEEVGAIYMVDMAHIAGLVAAGLHPSPVPFADVVTTTTHKTLRGPRGGLILCKEKWAKQIDKAVFPGVQGGPLEHIIAAKAVAFGEALKPEFKEYQRRIKENAKALCEAMKEEGFLIVSGDTDNHLMLVDLRPFGVTGREMEQRLDQVHITCNKNAIPNDPEKPSITSGIRLGTPAVTTRGFGVKEMKRIAHWIRLAATDFEANREAITREVIALCDAFPIYQK